MVVVKSVLPDIPDRTDIGITGGTRVEHRWITGGITGGSQVDHRQNTGRITGGSQMDHRWIMSGIIGITNGSWVGSQVVGQYGCKFERALKP